MSLECKIRSASTFRTATGSSEIRQIRFRFLKFSAAQSLSYKRRTDKPVLAYTNTRFKYFAKIFSMGAPNYICHTIFSEISQPCGACGVYFFLYISELHEFLSRIDHQKL